jgi:hypothetical protein
MWVPPAIAAGLRAVQRHHLAGEPDEPREEVERRRRAVRHAGFVASCGTGFGPPFAEQRDGEGWRNNLGRGEAAQQMVRLVWLRS